MSAEEAKKFNKNAEVLSGAAVAMLLSEIRRKASTQKEFVNAADRLMSILAEEGLARMATPTTIETPCGTYSGLKAVDGNNICAVDIMRSGCILLEAVRRICPDLKTAKILIQRDEKTCLPQFFYSKFPERVETLNVILCDPMLATGGSAMMAIDHIKATGVPEDKIMFLNVVASPQGLSVLAEKAPGVRIVTAALDEGVNEHGFIVPGLGDFGDRYYGTGGYSQGLWGLNGR